MSGTKDFAVRAGRALAEVTALRRDVASGGRELFNAWRPRIARPAFAASALNFAHYLVLRRHDLRGLQRKLMALGVSSLGRLESRVLVSLDAVALALAALARAPAPVAHAPSERRFFRGEARLAANAAEVFGPLHPGRGGHIMVTLGTEAADDPAVVLALAERGADAVRINCAHDSAAEWARMIANVRAAETSIGRRLPILMDIAGPKVRTGRVLTPPDRSRLHIGDLVALTREIAPSLADAPFQVTCLPPEILDKIGIGDRVLIDDGQLQGSVVKELPGGFLVHVEKGKLAGVKLRPEKGLNFPTIVLELSPLTDKDRADLDFLVEHADLIGYSFVETADHVAMLQAELARRRKDWQRIGLVGKIETPRAVRNLPEIIVQAAGHQPFAVMIARGDLAAEIGFERVAEMQEEILWLCEAAHVPVIWATQVLEDLIKRGLPSRGEMTDAAMAARAECVLLNKGPNVAAAVGVLDVLLRRMSEHQVKKTPTLRALHSWPDRVTPQAPAGG
jgi:pyruvate kinase